MFLIDDLLLAPVKGFKFILTQIQQMAERELNDDSTLKEELLELQMRLELEEISEEDYAAREAEIFARLRAIRARKLQLTQQVHSAESTALVVETETSTDVGPRRSKKRGRA